MNFQEQISLVQNDPSVKQFFENRNIYDFIKNYIQVDNLINTSHQELVPTFPPVVTSDPIVFELIIFN